MALLLSRFASRPVAAVAATWRRSSLRWASSLPPLTREQPSYAHITRGDYAKLEDADMTAFEAIMPGRVVSDAADLASYVTDWMRKFRGSAAAVLRPKTTEEVAAVMRHCHQRGLAVVPQGGNTGLVGGSVPLFDEVVISLELMNKVERIDASSRTLVCQAGCVLEVLDTKLAEHQLMMPLDLGAKGSCHIGGNISTNAGGLRFLRYGSLHGSVLGLEAVLADGTVIDNLTTLRKDNTGYDLKQLFIGSEGTLGIITGVAMEVAQRPAAVNVAFLACPTYSDVLKAMLLARKGLSEILSAFEFLDHEGMKCVNANAGVRSPLQEEAPFYVLIETHGSVAEHDEQKLEAFLAAAMEEGCVQDGVMAQGSAQMAAIWEVRERITESLQHDGWVYKYDISLPTSELYAAVEAMRDRVASTATRCVGFGHLGDGNLHLNVTSPEPNEALLGLIEPFLYEFTAQHRGSISAEHGMGLLKASHMHFSKSPESIALMKQLKGIMDPKGILNPYKTLP